MNSLKQRLIQSYEDYRFDYDPQETDSVIEILNDYDDELNGLKKQDQILLLRLLNDEDLSNEVELKYNEDDEKINPFD